jgi:hypothetical protein
MKIYISCALSLGSANANFYRPNEVHTRLIQHGHAVFNPALSLANFGAQRELTWGQWLANDLEWVKASDLVLRLPGDSRGADLEVYTAVQNNIRVVGPPHFEFLADLFPEQK